jgi:GNAT superfamily N-acetyltransferase
VIRAATEDDVDAVRRVGELTWPPTYAFAGDDYVAHGLSTWWSEEATTRSLRDTTVLVAVVDDEIVGMGNIDFRGDVPVIWRLYVVPAAQGTGAGSALLTALIGLVPTGAGAVRLEYVDGNDRAARFYARHGFRELRREPDHHDGRDDLPDIVWVERPVDVPG